MATFQAPNKVLKLIGHQVCALPEGPTDNRQALDRDINRTLTSLCLVSKKFYRVFSPMLWSQVSLVYDHRRGKMKPGTLVSMVVAGKLHLTKKLKIYAKVCQVDPKEALKDDYYIVDDDFDENEGEDSEKEYSEVDSLKDCDGDCNGMVEVGDFIKELVKFTPNLEHFSVTVLHDNLGSDALQALADYCPKLEVLLCKGDLEGAPYAEVPQPLRFPALRYLQLFNPSLTLLERFVAGAPKLEQTVVYRPVYVGVLFEDDSAMARWADRHDFTIFWGHLKHGKCGMPRHIRCRNFRITSPENSKAPVTYSSLFKWYGESLEGAAHRRARVSI